MILANSEEPYKMPHNEAFHQDLLCLQRQKLSSENKIQFYLEIIACNIITLDHQRSTLKKKGKHISFQFSLGPYQKDLQIKLMSSKNMSCGDKFQSCLTNIRDHRYPAKIRNATPKAPALSKQ